MSYFEELKRRSVFRVAAAYAVVAWLVLQVIDVVGPIVDIPEWLPRVTLTVIVIGFPVTLILAWVLELTPEGVKIDEDGQASAAQPQSVRRKLDVMIIVVLAAAVVLFAADKFFGSDDATSIVTADRSSIAVLPFRSISAAPNNEYFAEGLAEEIINLLSIIPDLKVIGRTSSFAFRDSDADARSIGAALDVTSVLEGSVRVAGDRLRISARLIDTSDASQIWTSDYDRVLSDVFEVQEEVATAIIESLQVHVGASPSRGTPTVNSDAYSQFLKARFEVNSFLFKEAEQTLRDVLELDPGFAEAWELLAYVYWFLSGTTMSAADGQRLVGDAASRALEFNPDLPIANVLSVSANNRPYSFEAEIEAIEQALAVKIDNPWLLDILVFRLVETGYLEEAVAVAERFVEADPLSAVAHNRHSEALYAVGRVDEAFASAAIVNDLDLTSDTAYWNLTHMSLAQNRDEDAIRYFQLFLEQFDIGDSSWVRELIVDARGSGAGAEVLDRSIPEIVDALPPGISPEIEDALSSWYLYFDEINEFYNHINELDNADGTWSDAEVPIWQGTMFRHLGFTANPRYIVIAGRLGLTRLWEQRGPPDYCRQKGNTWICD